MASHKRLKSVAQSIAHHSVSGLCYIHPYLSKACEKEQIESVQVDLLADNACPEMFSDIEPLFQALNNLKETFFEFLKKEGFSKKHLKRAVLTFEFYHGHQHLDHYCSVCTAELISTESKKYTSKVNYLGKTE